MEILTGAAAGGLAAILCAVFYRMGVRDGAGLKKTPVPGAEAAEAEAEAENELFRKYELIMGYDPYDEKSGKAGMR